jgi:DNA-directed RNA polymerase subunit omega
MIEALKSDAIVNKVGGRFKLTALIQRRLGQLMEGHRPLVERNGRTDLEIVIEEIMTDKIGLDFENASLVEAKNVSNGSDALL